MAARVVSSKLLARHLVYSAESELKPRWRIAISVIQQLPAPCSPMKKQSIAIRIVIGSVAAASLLPLAAFAVETPKYTIKEIMKAINKGDDSIGKKVSKGEGTPADFKKMVEYYSSLPLNDPPQGDAAIWKKKATAVLVAAKALEAGKSGALDMYKEAINCKACHTDFKPKDDHK